MYGRMTIYVSQKKVYKSPERLIREQRRVNDVCSIDYNSFAEVSKRIG
jgi:hypothetical protein